MQFGNYLKTAEKKEIIIFIISIFIFIFFSTAIDAQIITPPDPEISLTVNKENIEKNLLKISVLYKFPDNFHQTYNPDYFKAGIISPDNFQNYTISYPDGIDENGIINYYNNALINIDVDIISVSNGIYDVIVEAGYQLCDENGVCYFPGKKILSTQIELDRSNQFDFIAQSKNKTNILKYILFAFLGGLLLNLMPCVFPLLAVKTVSLAMQSGNNKRKNFYLSLSYGAGIVASLIIIVLFLIIFKTAGRSAGWGFHMQNPEFVIVLAAVIFLFALSMFDIFTITLPVSNSAEKISSIKGYAGQFLTGIFAVLIAAPCSAPLLGSAIAFALSANSIVILIFFIFIGIGFALPFILLGLYPAIIKKLPEPGKWSFILKEIMGFILLGVVIYLVSPIIKKYSETSAKILYFFLIIAFLAWFYGKIISSISSAKIRIFTLFTSIIIIIFAWSFLINFPKTDYKNEKKYYESISEKEYVMPFSPEVLNNLNSQNIPLFIDIYADWCTTCKINDALFFSSKEIKDFFEKNGIILLKGDFTEYDNDIAEWMKEFKKTGVPVYAYYHSSEDYSNPLFFPEILGKQAVIKKITETYLK